MPNIEIQIYFRKQFSPIYESLEKPKNIFYAHIILFDLYFFKKLIHFHI